MSRFRGPKIKPRPVRVPKLVAEHLRKEGLLVAFAPAAVLASAARGAARARRRQDREPMSTDTPTLARAERAILTGLAAGATTGLALVRLGVAHRGTVYVHADNLAGRGLVTYNGANGRARLALTDAGRAAVASILDADE